MQLDQPRGKPRPCPDDPRARVTGSARLLHAKRAARYWIGTARLSGYSSRLRADSGNVLCRRAFLTLDDVKLNLLTLAE